MMPGRWLGRSYPTDIQDSIFNLSRALDGLMAGTLEFTQQTDLDVSNEVRDLNARLVNDVIIESDRISDEEARTRIQELREPIGNLQIAFQKANVATGRPSVPTSGVLAIIPRDQAEELLGSFREAQRLYTEAVNRYIEARPAAESALAMPVSGNIAASMLSDVDRKIDETDQYTNDAVDAFEKLETILGDSGAAVQIDRSTFDVMRLWISKVREMDLAVQRLESMANRKPIENSLIAAARIVPWWVMALVAAGALAGIALLASKKKKK
jgi:hypothetical protein